MIDKATSGRVGVQRIIDLERQVARLKDAFDVLEDALQEAGDDYPGSSMQAWCVQQIKRAREIIGD
jgi:hypothetical protein